MNPRIQSLRGLACLLLVLYHVIGADPSNGLRVSDSPLRWMNDGLAYLRMPLFTFLSGMVYGLRPFDGDSRRFLGGKVRRLLVPMLVVGTLFAIVQANVPGTNSSVENWWTLHLVPVAHFWFVESLMWIFALVWLLECMHGLDSGRAFVAVWAAAAVVYLLVPGTRWLGIDGAIYLLPYFLCGLAVTRFSLWPRVATRPVQALLLALAALAAWQIGKPIPNPDRHTVWFLVVGVALCGLCLGMRLNIRWLARIGTASYAIYIFHVFFTAGSRVTLGKLELAILPLQIALGLAAGLLGPMVLEHFAARHRWSALALLGRSAPRPRPAPSRDTTGMATL